MSNVMTYELMQSVKALTSIYIRNQSIDSPYKEIMKEAERAVLVSAMSMSEGNQALAARSLSLNRGTLRKKLKAYGIPSKAE